MDTRAIVDMDNFKHVVVDENHYADLWVAPADWPDFTREAKRIHTEGCVVVGFEIESNGAVNYARVLQVVTKKDVAYSVRERLGQLAVNGVKGWKVMPWFEAAASNVARQPVSTFIIVSYPLGHATTHDACMAPNLLRLLEESGPDAKSRD